MKQFKQTNDGKYICEECGKICGNAAYFGRHILMHGTKEQYFEKWLKEETDEKCLLCGSKTTILKLKYNIFCSKKCSMLYRIKHGYIGFTEEVNRKSEETCLKKYGVKHIGYSKDVHKKTQNTCLKLYGNISGLGNKNIREKRKLTNIQKYGFPEIFMTKNFKEKSKQTCLKKYGVEYACQNKIICENIQRKQHLSAFKLNQFRDTNIFYQASYELDFLDKHYDRFPDIQRGPSIKYVFEGKNKVYHPDFFISSLNLIIEIKNGHLAEKDKEQIKAKQKATISNGYKYILIIDKNYNKFDEFIQSL